jgi:hypothetical protein
MGNRIKPDFFLDMKTDLAALKKSIKNFLFNDDYSNVRAMDPWVGLKNIKATDIWGRDPPYTLRKSTTRSWSGVSSSHWKK